MPVEPSTPTGLGPPERLERPMWRLELAGLGLLATLAVVSDLPGRVVRASGEATLALVPAIVAVAILHEVCHYLASRALGFRPVVEVVPPRVYAPGQWGTRTEAIVALLAPVVVVTAAGTVLWLGPFGPAAALVGHTAVVVNLAMAGGDLYATAVVVRLPPGSRTIVVETPDGPVEFVARPLST
ncbi:MAG: metalloprotease family protein [Halobacteriota archaeon]